jgi:hypothetical protein
MVTYQHACALVEFDIKVLIELFDALLLHPFFCVGELSYGTRDIELSGSKIPSTLMSATSKSFTVMDIQ